MYTSVQMFTSNRKALWGKDLRRGGRAAFALSPYGVTTYSTPHQQISCQTIDQKIILFGIKLYLNIPILFSGQFKIGLYNTDIEHRTKEKKKMKKELVSKWLVKGHKVVTAESKRLSDMIDQRMKEMLAEQDRRCGKK